MKAWLPALLLLLAGCSEPGPASAPATDEARTSDPGQGPPTVVPFEGVFVYHSEADMVCPLYLRHPMSGTSNAQRLDLGQATAIEVVLEWTAVEPVMQDLRVHLVHDGADTARDTVETNGQSPLAWRIDGPFQGYDNGGWLSVQGPHCPPDERTPRPGLGYEQEIRYRGNVTYDR